MSKRQPDGEWPEGSGADEAALIAHITQLAEAMAGTQVTELELTEGDLEIRLRRTPLSAVAVPGYWVAAPTASAAPTSSAPATPPPAPAPVDDKTQVVAAPLTGVYYATPSSDLPPFIQVGDVLKPGQIVCTVEAMKVFNEIKTEIGGTVVAIPPKHGQLVKKGEPLVRIRPN